MPNLGQEPIARNEAGRFDEIQFGWSGAGRYARAGRASMTTAEPPCNHAIRR